MNILLNLTTYFEQKLLSRFSPFVCLIGQKPRDRVRNREEWEEWEKRGQSMFLRRIGIRDKARPRLEDYEEQEHLVWV